MDRDADLAAQAVALLRSVGLRITRPRVAVLSLVVAAGDAHLSADDLLQQVTAQDADVHRATVYRTLDGLVGAGVVCHVHLDRGQRAYHLADTVAHPGGKLHLHAQCAECGRVIDLPPTVLGDAARRIHSASGFVLDPGHVALSGRCADCAATG